MAKPTSARAQFEKRLESLVEKFRKGRDEYMHASYSEAQVRLDFIDPLFEALGWDIRNTATLGKKEREVIVEQGETTGKPDYNFRVDGRTVFFVEAKAPHVPLDSSRVILQAKKYAFNETSETVMLAAATDFEEFRFYEVRDISYLRRVNKGLIFEHRYENYLTPQALDDLWQISRQAVLAGSLDKLITPAARRERQRIPLDQQFLADLSEWREKLAKAVFKTHPALHAPDLNSVVQVFLDRLIFIRVAEDRGVLARQLLDIAQSWKQHKSRPITAELLPLFRVVNQTLNGEIFKEHPCEKIDWDSALVAEIIEEGLEPYNFAQIGVELLGSIYERYLGKTIRVTEMRAIVEEKPAVRKAGGVYYTPKYIVDYIVAQTVGKLIEGKTPKQIAGDHTGSPLRILDPACGSGSFLLGAYQTLIDHHTRYFAAQAGKRTADQPRLIDEREGGEFKLSLEQKRAILQNNIFGVDIDPQAVEITMMSLYIKMLEGERGAITGQAVLPRLRDNIKCGNSLIGYDIGDLPDEDKARINPFDWHSKSEGFGEIMAAGGFDAVIGNPPYGAMLIDVATEYLLSRFKLQNYQLDTYLLFLEKAIELLAKKGLFGMIIPNTWLLNLQSEKIRQYLFSETQIENIVHYRRAVFQKVTVDTEITIISKQIPANLHRIQITIVNKDDGEEKYLIPQKRWKAGNGKPVNILERPELIVLADKLRAMTILDADYLVTQGAKPFQVGKGKPKQTRKVVDEKPYVSEKKRDSTFRPLLRGSLIQKYEIGWDRDYWISFGDWLAEPRYSANYDASAKIVVRQTGDSLVATLDREQFVVRDNLYTIVVREGGDLRYLLGLLNSKLLKWFYQTILNPEKGEALAQVKRGHLAQLPIRALNLADPADRSRHDKMVALVDRMLDLHKQKQATKSDAARARIEREIHVTDEQIDALVYELYGLTDEEIKVVES